MARIKDAVGVNIATNMIPLSMATITVTKPVAIGIGIAAVVVLYIGFKVGKFVIKTLLLLAALVAIGLAVWVFAQRG